jgi:hypothetical protein
MTADSHRRRPGPDVSRLIWRLLVAVSIGSFALPSVALVDWSNEAVSSPDEVDRCGCGCGNLEGSCCCTARAASRLGLSCNDREDPNIGFEGPGGAKSVGPGRGTMLDRPEPVLGALVDVSSRFNDLDPQPEIPPPRS